MRYLALFFIPLAGCVPQHLVPVDYHVQEDNYQAFVEAEGVTFVFENLEVTTNHLIFRLEVTNDGDKPVLIEPEKFMNLMGFKYTDSASGSYPVVAVNHALSAKAVDRYFKNKEISANVAGALLFVVGAAVVINDIAKDNDDSNQEYWDEDDEKRSAKRDLATFAALTTVDVLSDVAYADKMKARENLRFLPDELFMGREILPGERYHGKVFFPNDGLYKFYRLKIPLGDASLFFDFRRANTSERQHLYNRGF